MKLKNKNIILGVLVPLLRDGDFRDKNSMEVKCKDKIKFMAGRFLNKER